ncbi:MAG: VPLPA-CTERM sorting domain-containing protein [Pseudomonadota bacterium]
MIKFSTLVVAAAMLAMPGIALAETLKFSFTGAVESINDGGNNNLPGGLGPFNVGDELSGMFTLDTALFTGGTGTRATYGGAVDNLMVTIDGNTYLSTAAGSATVRNDDMAGSAAPLRDIFLASWSVSGPSAGGLSVSGFQISFGGTDAFAAGSISGVGAPSIAEFFSLFNNDSNDGNTKILGFSDDSDVRFDVETLSIEVVPLPAAFGFLLAAIGGLGALRLRRG